MNNEEQRKKRLKFMADNRMKPFDLDFFREVGFEFGLEWDGQLIIEFPESVSVDKLTTLIKQFSEGIKKSLYFEGQIAKSVLVGGPMNGKPYFNSGWPNHPLCYHVKRGEWLVYMVKSQDDPRAWFVGKAKSKKKAKALTLRRAK